MKSILRICCFSLSVFLIFNAGCAGNRSEKVGEFLVKNSVVEGAGSLKLLYKTDFFRENKYVFAVKESDNRIGAFFETGIEIFPKSPSSDDMRWLNSMLKKAIPNYDPQKLERASYKHSVSDGPDVFFVRTQSGIYVVVNFW